jgi:prepilin-type N-terminal cleavage/methylation domain-containing protein
MIPGKQETKNLALIKNQKGFSIVENLVALSILAIASASTMPLLVASFHATQSDREQASIMGEVNQIISNYKSSSLNSILSNIQSDISNITDGQVAQISQDSNTSNNEYQITFTAIKSQAMGSPEAIRITIEAIHNRKSYGEAIYTYETIITSLG